MTEHKKQKTENGISVKTLTIFAAGLVIGLIAGSFIPGLLPGTSHGVSGLQPGRDLQTSGPDKAVPAEKNDSAELSTVKESNYSIADIVGTLPTENKDEYISWMREHTQEQVQHLQARWDLASKFIDSKELRGLAIEAFLKTPREHFVREENRNRPYADTWMAIGWGATITDPDVVSMMTTTLAVKPGMKVLEIGTGSGYQSAMLSNMSDEVYTIEIIEPLFHETDELYNELENQYPAYSNIRRKKGDGFYGWEKYAPFDRIIVTCAIDHLPPPLLDQLSVDGIMVVPLGPPWRQLVMEVRKIKNENGRIVMKRRDVYNGVGVKFIPFRDESGESYSTTPPKQH